MRDVPSVDNPAYNTPLVPTLTTASPDGSERAERLPSGVEQVEGFPCDAEGLLRCSMVLQPA